VYSSFAVGYLASNQEHSLSSAVDLNMTKRIITWVVGLLVLAGVVAAAVMFFRKPSEPEIKYATSAVERGRIEASITASGTVSALVTVQVGSQVSGRIESLEADYNSVVKKGQVVARIDPRSFKTDLTKAKANSYAANGNLARAQAQATNAAKQLARIKGLVESGLSPQTELDTAETAAVAAQAEVQSVRGSVEQARAAVEQSQINLDYTVIHSPIDGVVISRSVDVGQTVAASLSAPTLFTIAEDLRKMQVDTYVAESDVGKLKPGMDASFTVDAYPGKKFTGKLREVRNAPQTVQNVVTYDAVIDVANPELELKPGMTANVSFSVASRENPLRLVNAALRYRPPAGVLGSASPVGSGRPSGSFARAGGSAAPGGVAGPNASGGSVRTRSGGGAASDRKTVYVLRNGAPVAVRIRVGITDGSTTEIVEGDLHEGDQVITSSTGGADATTDTASKTGSSPVGGAVRRMF
jgi:HlyD family secretion protein